MLAAGVDVVRLNFSHGVASDHIERAQLVRECAQKLGREVAIMADLQGPKIRVGKFADGRIELVPGHDFILDSNASSATTSASASTTRSSRATSRRVRCYCSTTG